MKGSCVKNIATFLWMFWKAFNRKTQKKNVRTVYNLFDHWNMVLSSDFHHLKTHLATRLVLHPFYGLSNSCWTIFLCSSLRSLPFTLTLYCTTAWFKQLSGFALWSFSCSIYMYHSLNLWLTPNCFKVSKDNNTAACKWLDPCYLCFKIYLETIF